MGLFSRDKLEIYKLYVSSDNGNPDQANDIEVVAAGSDFSVFFIHIFWPLTRAMPLLFLLHICILAAVISVHVYLAGILLKPQFMPIISASYALFLLTVAAFGNDWKEQSLIRRGYKEAARVCASNRERALELFFNGSVHQG